MKVTVLWRSNALPRRVIGSRSFLMLDSLTNKEFSVIKIPGDDFSELVFKTAKIRLWKSGKRFQELSFPGLFFVYYLLYYFRSFNRSFKEIKNDSILRTLEWITALYKAEVRFNCHYDPAFKGISN